MSYAGYRHQRGRGGGRRHGRGAAFWDAPYYGELAAPRPALDEKAVALRQSIVATFTAARLVARDGSQEKTAKAAELLDGTRKGLYRILAGETD